jgi:hypothetical protein
MVSTLWVANEPSFRRDGNVPWNLRNDACATKEFDGKCGAYEVLLLLQIMPGHMASIGNQKKQGNNT